MKAMRGAKNAGYTIIGEEYIEQDHGYVIAKNRTEYVTWRFVNRGDEASYYGGHYFPIDIDSPMKSAAKAFADYHNRIADAYDTLAKYGC